MGRYLYTNENHLVNERAMQDMQIFARNLAIQIILHNSIRGKFIDKRFQNVLFELQKYIKKFQGGNVSSAYMIHESNL